MLPRLEMLPREAERRHLGSTAVSLGRMTILAGRGHDFGPPGYGLFSGLAHRLPLSLVTAIFSNPGFHHFICDKQTPDPSFCGDGFLASKLSPSCI